jgi:hypothetical protein
VRFNEFNVIPDEQGDTSTPAVRPEPGFTGQRDERITARNICGILFTREHVSFRKKKNMISYGLRREWNSLLVNLRVKS